MVRKFGFLKELRRTIVFKVKLKNGEFDFNNLKEDNTLLISGVITLTL